ncbi:Zn-ribbon domain-containing OB-fold protein [Halobaculum sp. D14]|uniref:Zn-ribbon domain-containing OB-fold protein n=1 Tax=Halobaculum sp. D14 TaxID=3421642 RepID=UPI003EBD6EBC
MSGDAAPPTDTGYDEWVASLGDGGYYLACPDGHGSLPPRRVCPECGSDDLTERDLPETGAVETFTEQHVAAPAFADDVPYVTAVVEFGPVRLTGVVRGVDAADVEIGQRVTVDATDHDGSGRALVVFRPA